MSDGVDSNRVTPRVLLLVDAPPLLGDAADAADAAGAADAADADSTVAPCNDADNFFAALRDMEPYRAVRAPSLGLSISLFSVHIRSVGACVHGMGGWVRGVSACVGAWVGAWPRVRPSL